MRTGITKSEPRAFSGQFDDFDAFTESVTDWDTDLRQLENGSLQTSLFQAIGPEMSIGGACFSQPCLQAGSAPADMHTFSILDGDVPPTRYCGEQWNLSKMAIIGQANGFESTSPAGFTIYTFSVTEACLQAAAKLHGLKFSASNIPVESSLMEADPQAIARLRTRFRNIIAAVGEESPPYSLETVTSAITLELLQILEGPGHAAWITGKLHRHHLLSRAKDYINDHLNEAVKVQDVAADLGVSTRAVEKVFRELQGVTPLSYIKTARLYAFHRALKSSEPSRRVSRVAGEWGFWHMGQLARDYRARFSLLPSQTLGQSNDY